MIYVLELHVQAHLILVLLVLANVVNMILVQVHQIPAIWVFANVEQMMLVQDHHCVITGSVVSKCDCSN